MRAICARPPVSTPKSLRRWLRLVAAMAAVVIIPSAAQAGQLTFNLNTQFDTPGGTAPSGTAPWLKAVFDDSVGPNKVSLTLTSLLQGAGEFVTEWDFNVDPTKLSGLSIAQNTGPSATIKPVSADTYQADGDGKYDISLVFASGPPAARFTVGSVATFTLTGTGITANSFNFLSAPAGGHGPFTTAAHVQGIGPSASLSGWIAPTDHINSVPEPATIIATLTGLVPVGLLSLRRRMARRAATATA